MSSTVSFAEQHSPAACLGLTSNQISGAVDKGLRI